MFNKSGILKNEIDSYLENIGVSVTILENGVTQYLAGQEKDFIRQVDDIRKVESDLDSKRKDIEQKLYKNMLLPESRGDILGLLEHLDEVANYGEKLLISFKAERPFIPEEFHKDLLKIASYCRSGVRELTEAIHRFFMNQKFLTGPLGQVRYFEHEIDQIYEDLISELFKHKKLDLSQKIHIRYFAENLSRISDIAEDVSERLVISTLKRGI